MNIKRIAIKIGSNVLTRQDGTLDITRMSAIADQIATLHKKGFEIILVSSGAVASGRSEINPNHTLDEVSSRQLYSAIGQAKLMGKYYTLLREHSIICGQVLTTKEGLDKADHYQNQQHCMEVMLAEEVIPIVNENDTLSITELMFTDNDELSGLIAEMMQVEMLIILSNIDGIYNGNPSNPESYVIRSIKPETNETEQYIQSGKSSMGRGGMLTKYHIAQRVAAQGIPVIIANGRKEDILLHLIDNPEETICTRFEPTTPPK
ncbi:MAG: glutamate 5-kinase [Bacteroidaceae bacterium]|nr:glutamate 5-kinase [Bacteroidaceae bacterium]